jgi:Ca2+-transporting ATPase
MCYAEVKSIGNNTELGKIGKSVEAYVPPKTHLQLSIRKFVQRLALFGILGFAAIWLMNYFRTGEILTSLLSGLTLIMAAIPEEIPVAFSSFMALGAFRLSKKGIISRHPVVIENLGAVSVICLDKTGTITQNKMEVRSVFDYIKGIEAPPSGSDVLYYARLASEITPYDEMEKAIQKACSVSPSMAPEELFFEYSLEGHPPMMTHVWGKEGKYIVAAKGAPERIMEACHLNEEERDRISQMIFAKAAEGHRILAIAACTYQGTLPASQNEFPWQFKGFISLYDPPKKGIDMVFRQFKEAGIQIKLITGDYAQTARNIAFQVGLYTGEKHIDGKSVMSMDMATLQKNVKEQVIFARMHPEAKLRVIEALKLNGEIVAMTGDGVNDGPALKASHIGIAMGKHGTQIARQASDIILTDDDMSKVTEAIEQGRKIFANLKKAIRYIISIHIPIILIASLPLLLNWKYPSIFTPIHVIFLELIMGPTCSIFFENEPATPGLMKKQPRKRDIGLFTGRELLISIIQGLAITAGLLGLHYHYTEGHSLAEVRSIVFTTLLLSNIFLTFTNRSFSSPIFHTIHYRNRLAPVVLTVSTLFILILHVIPEVRMLFGMEPVSAREMITCLTVSLVSVSWIELVKIGNYYRKPRN